MRAILFFAVVVTACGPPLNAGRDGGADGGGSEAGSDAGTSASCPAPAPNGCSLLDSSQGQICSVRDFAVPTAGGECLMNATTGTMTATLKQASADQPFAAPRVAARRLNDRMMEVVGVEKDNAIRIVVPAQVGSHPCTKATGAWILFTSFVGTNLAAAEGQALGTVEVTSVGNQVSGTFSIDGAFDVVDGTFTITLAQ